MFDAPTKFNNNSFALVEPSSVRPDADNQAILAKAKELRSLGFKKSEGYAIQADFESKALIVTRSRSGKIVGSYSLQSSSASNEVYFAPEPAV